MAEGFVHTVYVNGRWANSLEGQDRARSRNLRHQGRSGRSGPRRSKPPPDRTSDPQRRPVSRRAQLLPRRTADRWLDPEEP